MARSTSSGVNMSYALPVLWMTSCFRTIIIIIIIFKTSVGVPKAGDKN